MIILNILKKSLFQNRNRKMIIVEVEINIKVIQSEVLEYFIRIIQILKNSKEKYKKN